MRCASSTARCSNLPAKRVYTNTVKGLATVGARSRDADVIVLIRTARRSARQLVEKLPRLASLIAQTGR